MGRTIGDAQDPGVSTPGTHLEDAGMHLEDTGMHPEDDLNPSNYDGLADLNPTTTNDNFGYDKDIGISDTPPDYSEFIKLAPDNDIALVHENPPEFPTNTTETNVPAPAVDPVNVPPQIAGVDDETVPTGPR